MFVVFPILALVRLGWFALENAYAVLPDDCTPFIPMYPHVIFAPLTDDDIDTLVEEISNRLARDVER